MLYHFRLHISLLLIPFGRWIYSFYSGTLITPWFGADVRLIKTVAITGGAKLIGS